MCVCVCVCDCVYVFVCIFYTKFLVFNVIILSIFIGIS